MHNELPKMKRFAVTWPTGKVSQFVHNDYTGGLIPITEDYVKGVLFLKDKVTGRTLKPVKVKRTK
jgi:hypothetical protein